jgi:plastocyanin
MRRCVALTTVLLTLLALVGCGDDDGDAGPSPGTEGPGAVGEDPQPTDDGEAGVVALRIESSAFVPAEMTVEPGTTVRVTNNDAATHTWTADDDDGWNSDGLGQGDTYEHTFDEAGSFGYHCSIHPGMTGTVQVS